MTGKSLSNVRLQKHIAKLRKKNKFWQLLGSQAVQDVCQRLDKAYQKFFKEKGTGRPGFQKGINYPSFTLKQCGWKRLGANRLRIGTRVYKFALSREVLGAIKTITIKRDRTGKMWVCFSVLEDGQYPAPNEEVTSPVGLDFGLKVFLTTSSGIHIKSPEFYRTSLSDIQKASKELSRKQRGSNNRKKAKLKLAKLHQRIANQRRDFFFKTAHKLCDMHDAVAVEDLNMKGMQALWGRKVSDLGFAEFVNVLEYTCKKRGISFEKVERFFASTKTCSVCGEKETNLSLADRSWTCKCGAIHDRDLNAAINIRERAFSQTSDRASERLGDVSQDRGTIAPNPAVAA